MQMMNVVHTDNCYKSRDTFRSVTFAHARKILK